MTADLEARIGRIRLALFDVDGVFTDGRIYLGPDGNELKAFHTRDGFGIRRLLAAGVAVGVISGRNSEAVARRMSELGVRHVFQGCGEKWPVCESLIAELGITAPEVAYMGDDVPDIPVMQRVGLAACPKDCHADVVPFTHYRTHAGGGRGAVREFCDLLLADRQPGGDG